MTGEWVYGSLLQKGYHAWIIDDSVKNKQVQCDIKITSKPIPVDPATVGEYTGRNDISDIDVFEGDRLGTIDGYELGVVAWSEEYLSWVIMNDGEVFEQLCAYESQDIKVIGNICDDAVLAEKQLAEYLANPELMEGETE